VALAVTGAALLVLGLAAALLVLNAWRPRRRGRLALVSWALAWFATELAAHALGLLLALAVLLIWLGALGSPTGWAGLAVLAAAVAAGLPLAVSARRTVVDADPALAKGPSALVAYPRWHVLMPFLAWRRRDVVRISGVEFARIGNLRLKLDVTLPRDPATARRPAIINVHGGAWVTGSRRQQGVPLLGHLAANGWVGFNIDYRLSPRATWPDHIVDVKRAIAWVRAHADEYDVDPRFIAITGGSAGGHLAAFAALSADDRSLQPGFEDADTSVAACVPFYGIYDFVDEERHTPLVRRLLRAAVVKQSRREHPEAYRAASPIFRVGPDAPPFLVVHAQNDTLTPVAGARAFVRALREVSRQPAHYIELKGGQHAFDVIPSWRTLPTLDAVLVFLDATWRAHREAAAPPPTSAQDVPE
jgi:acetyl esterase/lipase